MATRTAATITMSMREVDRVKTVQAVVDRMLPVGLAAKRLGLSRRQLERLLLKYQAKAPRAWSRPSLQPAKPTERRPPPSRSDDLTTVGVCVACATPPVDKSAPRLTRPPDTTFLLGR